MATFTPTKHHLREVLLHYYILKKSAAETYRMLVDMYGDHSPSSTTCKEWFRRFQSDDYDVSDRKRKGAPKIYYELLKPSETITGDRYRLQLIRLNRALKEKRPEWDNRHNKLILLHDNARP